MATVEEKKEVESIREIIAHSRPIYRELVAVASALEALSGRLKTFDVNLTILLNAQESLERRKKDAEAEIAKTEKAAKDRLMTMEHGHRTLVDELSRKQIAADDAKAQAEKLQRKAEEARAEADLLKDHYEKKIAELTAAHPKKK